MRILADLHHHDLYYSLQLLFEKRLGWEMYRPIGLDWYHQKYWQVYNHPATAQQYLSTDGLVPLNIHGEPVTKEHGEGAWVNKGSQEVTNGFYSIPDTTHVNPIPHKGITLEAFKNTKFDILLASMPAHIPTYRKLIQEYQPQAKFIFQAGNNWNSLNVENLLTSAKQSYSSVPGANVCFYHQEFDLDFYKPGPCANPRSILNLQHLAGSADQLRQLEACLPGWDVKICGAGNRDGPVNELTLAQRIRDAGFIWHVKQQEGYGYNIHHAFACGRPMVVNAAWHQNYTAYPLYTDGTTVVDVSNKNTQQTADALIKAADTHQEWCENAYQRFTQVVNFDAEFEEIKKFLERLR